MTIRIVYAKAWSGIFNRAGALESYIYKLAYIFNKSEHKVYINQHLLCNIQQEKARNTSSPISSSLKKRIPQCIKRLLRDIYQINKYGRLYKAINKSEKADIIIEFSAYGSGIGYKLKKKTKAKYILIQDAPVLEEYGYFNKGVNLLHYLIQHRESKSLKKADAIVVYSEAVATYLNKQYKLNKEFYIHQNIDFSRFDYLSCKKDTNCICIGFIGSFLPWHNTLNLLRAFNKLKEEKYNIELLLIGKGEQYSFIKEKVELSEYKKDIKLTGFLDGEELLEAKKQIHIGVMPGSNWYGAPNKLFEYGAAGMAAVAPATPTITSLFTDKKNCLLFKDEKTLYCCLKELLDNSMLREQLASSLQENIKRNYAEEITAHFYEKLIKRIPKYKKQD